jgi:hypothetical protein
MKLSGYGIPPTGVDRQLRASVVESCRFLTWMRSLLPMFMGTLLKSEPGFGHSIFALFGFGNGGFWCAGLVTVRSLSSLS